MNAKSHTSICLLLFVIAVLSSGCADRSRFLVCPSEYANEMRSENRLSQQREILFRDKEYAILIFQVDADGNYIPMQHYRPEHTFTSREHPELVTWNQPLHVSTIVIIDSPKNEVAIAVKKDSERSWRQYRTNKEKIVRGGEIGIVYLPPFEELELIPDAMIKNR